MAKIFICEICGDAYLGEEPPTNCPFCGAHQGFIKVDYEYPVPEEPIKNLTEQTRANLIASLGTEMRNATFYEEAAKKAKDLKVQKLFKFLKKVELEHASVFRKALGIAENPKPEFELCGNDHDNLKLARMYEMDAIEHYKKFLSEATEERAKKIFAALIAVEEDHLNVEEDKLGNF